MIKAAKSEAESKIRVAARKLWGSPKLEEEKVWICVIAQSTTWHAV